MKQKKFLVLFLLFFLGGYLPFVTAIPMFGEDAAEEKTIGSQAAIEQNRRVTETGQNSSSSSQRGTGINIQENREPSGEDQESNFSDEELDNIIEEATQTTTFWKGTRVNTTTSPNAVQELVARLEKDEMNWEKKQEQLSLLGEQIGVPEKLELVLLACSEALNALREQEAQLLPTRQRSRSLSDSSAASVEECDEAFSSSMAALSLKDNSSSSALSQSQSCVLDHTSLETQQKIISLTQEAQSLRKYAQQRGDRAHQEHREARNSFVNRLLTQAEDYYQDAISSAQKTASAWEKSEKAHQELMQISGKKIRQWGQRLKTIWQERAQAWEEERRKLFEYLERKKNEEMERQQKTAELQQCIDRTIANKQAVLTDAQAADQEKRNEIGATCDSIARKYTVIEKHLKKVLEAHQSGDIVTDNSIERKIEVLQKRIEDEALHLDFLKEAMTKWKQNYQTEESRYLETREKPPQSDGTKIESAIYKPHFIGPLLRIERVFDASDKCVEEIKVAAEHLMVRFNSLTSVQDSKNLLAKLQETFSENQLKIKSLFPQQGLYQLCFQPIDSDQNPLKRLNLFDQIKKAIEENQLAVDCYPDLFSELSSSKSSSGSNGLKPAATSTQKK